MYLADAMPWSECAVTDTRRILNLVHNTPCFPRQELARRQPVCICAHKETVILRVQRLPTAINLGLCGGGSTSTGYSPRRGNLALVACPTRTATRSLPRCRPALRLERENARHGGRAEVDANIGERSLRALEIIRRGGAGDGWGEAWVSADFDAAGSASGGPRTQWVRS